MTNDTVFNWAKLIAPGLKVLGWAALLLVILIRYGDRLDSAEASIKSLQEYNAKQQEVIGQMQLNNVRESTILSQVENSLARDENKIDQLEQKH